MYTVAFYHDSRSAQEMEAFLTEFHEFVYREYQSLKLAHLLIPDYLCDDIILDIRNNPAVDSITHEVLIETHGWEKTKISASKFSSGKFEGDGAGVLIFIIDSGIDDHPEFENRVDRSLSMAFGDRNATSTYADTYASSATIEEAMLHIYEEVQLDSEYSDKRIVVNLSNGPSVPADASTPSLIIEEAISNAGGIVIRAGGNKDSDVCSYGQLG
eukprot:Awhi_evm1s803